MQGTELNEWVNRSELRVSRIRNGHDFYKVIAEGGGVENMIKRGGGGSHKRKNKKSSSYHGMGGGDDNASVDSSFSNSIASFDSASNKSMHTSNTTTSLSLSSSLSSTVPAQRPQVSSINMSAHLKRELRMRSINNFLVDMGEPAQSKDDDADGQNKGSGNNKGFTKRGSRHDEDSEGLLVRRGFRYVIANYSDEILVIDKAGDVKCRHINAILPSDKICFKVRCRF